MDFVLKTRNVCIKMLNFALKMLNFALKMMKFVFKLGDYFHLRAFTGVSQRWVKMMHFALKTRYFVSKMRNFVFKMMHFAGDKGKQIDVRVFGSEWVNIMKIKTEESCIKNEEFCIIKRGILYLQWWNLQGHASVLWWVKTRNFVL